MKTTSFTPLTTPQALRLLMRCHAAIVANILHAIHRFVTRRPYAAITLVILASVAVSASSIMKARAERDSANHAMVKLQQQVESLSCAVEAGKEARRWK